MFLQFVYKLSWQSDFCFAPSGASHLKKWQIPPTIHKNLNISLNLCPIIKTKGLEEIILSFPTNSLQT